MSRLKGSGKQQGGLADPVSYKDGTIGYFAGGGMNDEWKSQIVAILNKFPEVMWDRWSGLPPYQSVCIFGWIKRPDSHEDYIELGFWEGEPDYVSTSSARYSADFAHRLNFTHADCQRVEDWFNVPNAVKLPYIKH